MEQEDIDFTEQEISDILEKYKNKKKRDKERYDKIKDTEEFKTKNRENAKKYYDKMGKDEKQKYYNENKEYIKIRNKFYYYKKRDRIQHFINQFPNEYELLVKKKYIK